MSKWLVLVAGVVVLGAVVAVLLGRMRETARIEEKEARLLQSVARPVDSTVDFRTFEDLPEPVARYFRHVLVDGQPIIETVTFQQRGTLRTRVDAESWSTFRARQTAAPLARGFLWNAKVDTPLSTHVRVLDSYMDGVGAGRVSLLSAIALGEESGTPELNAGALHRYLAEAVWYPTALLPQSGVTWSPIDENAALATLTDHGTTVSLEFRFNATGEATAIFTPERFGNFGGVYRQVPWEGHFRDYQVQAGMRVPAYGQVGWYTNDALAWVWKGDFTEMVYRFVE